MCGGAAESLHSSALQNNLVQSLETYLGSCVYNHGNLGFAGGWFMVQVLSAPGLVGMRQVGTGGWGGTVGWERM